MAKSDAERARAYRARQRGGEPRELQPCGTYAAYMRHKRKKEPVCDPCRLAYNAHQREQYKNR